MFKALFLILFAFPAMASESISMPGAGPQNYYDEFSAGSTRCRQSITSGATFDSGLITDTDSDPAIYARISVPLGKKSKRINCRKLFDIELRKQQIELELLERELYMVEDD